VWGEAHRGGRVCAVYFVRWSPEQLNDVAEWLIVTGEWGDAPREARSSVALKCRFDDGRPGFMVVDSHASRLCQAAVTLGVALERSDVVNSEIARDVYPIVDAVMVQDARVRELLIAMRDAEPTLLGRWLRERVSKLLPRRHALLTVRQ
jgi:hypothetical protein